MKRSALLGMIGVAMLVTCGMAIGRAPASGVQRASVQFSERTKFVDVILKGEYVVVHDHDKMAKGLPCTDVYEYIGGVQGKLVTSFHCVPVERTRAKGFTIVLARLTPDLNEVKEFQFAGDTEAHQVPKS